MVTQSQADQWLGQQIGQHLDYDKAYGQQCVDFFNYYYQFISGDSPYADDYGVDYAKQLWDVPTDKFDKIPDSNILVPELGDVLVYGEAWGAGYGHVEVCRWSDSAGCHVIGENEHNDPAQGVVEVYRSWAGMRGLIGVLRPRFSSEVSNEPTQTETPSTAPEVPQTPVQETQPETQQASETPTQPANTPAEPQTPSQSEPETPPHSSEAPSAPSKANPLTWLKHVQSHLPYYLGGVLVLINVLIDQNFIHISEGLTNLVNVVLAGSGLGVLHHRQTKK